MIVESRQHKTSGGYKPFYRVLIVNECLFYTRRGISNILNPFGNCKCYKPMSMAISILMTELDKQMTFGEICEYFNMPEHHVKKLIEKHRQFLSINRIYRENYEKCVSACQRAMRALNV